KRVICITDLSRSEAEYFIEDFTSRVSETRKLSTPKKRIDDSFKVYHIIPNLENYDTTSMAYELCESEVPLHRGLRAVYINEDTDEIIVGTTVVYSANWAMLHFDDETIETILFDYI